jgi:hydrogenase expression/formation protein HypD
MRFVDEYRDPVAARALVGHITELSAGEPFKFMEVCGGHTHTIYRHGIEHVLPEGVELVHGPGCPVCVIPMGRVDDAVALAERPDVVFTTFGDMMRVPSSGGSLLDAKAEGADVRFVYSPLDALKLARQHPDRPVVFFAIGFETTAPSTAATVLRARADGIRNFFVFCNHVTIVPAIKAILDSPGMQSRSQRRSRCRRTWWRTCCSAARNRRHRCDSLLRYAPGPPRPEVGSLVVLVLVPWT